MPKRRNSKSDQDSRRFCPHCNDTVSRRTYFYHRKEYFSQTTNTWSTETMFQSQLGDSDSDSDNFLSTGNENMKQVDDVESLDIVQEEDKIKQMQLEFINKITKEAQEILNDFENKNSRNKDVQLQTEESLMCKIDSLDSMKLLGCLRTERKRAITNIQEMIAVLEAQEVEISIGRDSAKDTLMDESTDSDDEVTLDFSNDSDSDFESCNADIDLNDLRKRTLEFSNSTLLDQCSTQVQSTEGTARQYLLYFLCFILLWKSLHIISNNAMTTFIVFLRELFMSMNSTDPVLVAFVSIFPASLYTIWKMLGVNKEDFETYVVCPKCTKLFRKEDILKEIHGRLTAKTCDNVLFPQGKHNRRCNAQLVKRVLLKNAKVAFVPIISYPYASLINSLENLLSRPDIEQKCEEWRRRHIKENEYADVYDGEVWKTFLTVNGTNFLNEPNNYGLMINVDWFQPFERRKDISVGAIYMTVMNLPRQLRFRRENVLLLGIIPAMTKEPASLNHFLKPVIRDLLILWKGINLKSFLNPAGIKVRAALLCASADIPAARKLCGFLGHNAFYGCSKCFKSFPGGFGEKRNYSGFNHTQWQRRSIITHKRAVDMIQNCSTLTSRKKMESKYGCRYSALLELPYFNVVRHHVIDPMHNLFLGTAKTMFKIWVQREILTISKLTTIDEKLSDINIPHDYGRLPTNISSNWGSFTADQWKNWTLIYSLIILKEVLPTRDFKVWHTFSQACRVITKPVITSSNILAADHLFRKFGKEVQELYGDDAITMNMHLHCHLIESVKDYGSLYGFWLFSFERYNGILTSLNTNKHNIEVQLMREFTTTDQIFGIFKKLPQSTFENLYKLMMSSFFSIPVTYTIDDVLRLHRMSYQSLNLVTAKWDDFQCIQKPDLCKTKYLESLDVDDSYLIFKTYQFLYPDYNITKYDMTKTCFLFKSIHIAGEYYSSTKDHRGKKFAHILAAWCDKNGELNPNAAMRPGNVKFFFEHVLTIQGNPIPHIFAAVQWYKEDEKSADYPVPISSWKNAKYENASPASFIPVQRIHGKYATYCKGKTVYVTPLYRRILM